MKRLPRGLEADYRKLYKSFNEGYEQAISKNRRSKARLLFWNMVTFYRVEAIDVIDAAFGITPKQHKKLLRGLEKQVTRRWTFRDLGANVPLAFAERHLRRKDSPPVQRKRFKLLPGGKR